MTAPTAHISVWCHGADWNRPTVEDRPVDAAFVDALPGLLADDDAVLDLPATESKARRLIPVRSVSSITVRPTTGETR